MSATIGVRSAMAPKSSMSRSIPNSWAIASRCRTPFVEPPVAATDAMPFSSADRVTIDDGRMSRRTRSITSSPERRAASSFFGSSAGMPLSPPGDSPMNSRTMLIVLAVYWPPHAPAPGHAAFSIPWSSSRLIFPAR